MDAYERFHKALATLEDGMTEYPPPVTSPVIVYGLAHAFNVCFEQAWKFLKAWGEREGYKEAASGSPRTIIKLAYKAGWIRDEHPWIDMLKVRQRSVHAYGAELGAELMDRLPDFYRTLAALDAESSLC